MFHINCDAILSTHFSPVLSFSSNILCGFQFNCFFVYIFFYFFNNIVSNAHLEFDCFDLDIGWITDFDFMSN